MGSSSLGQRLRAVGAAAYVGRERELEELRRFLAPGDEHRVLLVHGPGGIGKSALIRRAIDGLDGAAVIWLDGRDLAPVPRALDDALEGAMSKARPVVVIDSYERIGPLDRHLREELLTRLPDATRVVISGRASPDPAWYEGGWELLAREITVGGLSDTESTALLEARGVHSTTRRERIVAWAAGSPLALTLAAGAVAGERAAGRSDRAEVPDGPEVYAPLIRRLVDPEARDEHLATLGIASIARQITPEMLDDVHPGADGAGEYAWLTARTYVEPLGEGVAPHAVVREALRADLRARDPSLERELRRRIADHLHARAMRSGDLLLSIDLAHLAEDPKLRWGFSWEAASRHEVGEPRDGDAEEIAGVLGDAGVEREGPMRFLDESPEHVTVCRDGAGAVLGVAVAVTNATAPPFAKHDPVLGPRLGHAAGRARLGEAIVWRCNFDLAPGSSGGRTGLLGVASVLRSVSANPRFGYLPIVAGGPGVRFAAAAGARHLPELDARVGDAVIECHLIDWGEGGLLTAQRDQVYRELGLEPPEPATIGISFESVREALRSLGDRERLERSPLAHGETAAERAASVERLVREGVEDAFDEGPRDAILRSVLSANYFDSGTDAELAADRLHLSRASFYRRLREATVRLTRTLAEQDGGKKG